MTEKGGPLSMGDSDSEKDKVICFFEDFTYFFEERERERMSTHKQEGRAEGDGEDKSATSQSLLWILLHVFNKSDDA